MAASFPCSPADLVYFPRLRARQALCLVLFTRLYATLSPLLFQSADFLFPVDFLALLERHVARFDGSDSEAFAIFVVEFEVITERAVVVPIRSERQDVIPRFGVEPRHVASEPFGAIVPR